MPSGVLALILAVFLPPLPVLVEPDQAKPVTNETIASMLKAGLAESTILLAIQLAAERGTAEFDTDPAALIELKNQGATAQVLDTMILTEARPRRPPPSTTVAGLPAERGVYYQAGGRWLEAPSVLLWPEMKTSWKGLTAIEHRRYVLPGPRGGLRVSEARPTFYAREMELRRGWQLLKLETRKDYREIRAAPREVFQFTPAVSVEGGQALELEFKPVAHDVFMIRPVSDLPAGEYLLAAPIIGQHWLLSAYEFGVDPR